jgi:hypothetical protein
MASQTIQQRLDRLTIYLNEYLPLQKIPPQLLIKFIERSRDHVWRKEIVVRDNIFRKFATVASDADVPVDYVSYANNAYYVVSSVNVPFAFANIQEIGAATNNRYALGTATTPKIFFSDQKIRTIPTGLSGIQFEYVFKPTALDGAPLSTTDEMPEDTEAMIVRGAFERALGQLRNDRDMLELSGLTKEEVQKATQQYYLDYYQKTVLASGGIELAEEKS